jgi:hypothetical protein
VITVFNNLSLYTNVPQNFFTRGTSWFVKDTWWHTTKFCLAKMGYKTAHCHKYVSTYLCTSTYKKVKLSFYTPWRHMGTRWGWVVSITPQPCFTPRERTPGAHWTGGWVGPRVSLDTEARRKILYLCRGSNPSCPVCSQTLYWLSYPGSIYI